MKNVPALPAVLVVDDEVRSQEALRRTLEEDFTVFTASGADEAMAIMEREQGASGGKGVQVVLCDQRMPGTSGVAFLTEVRQRWPDVVRIVLSGYTEAGDIIAGINEAGIYQYLLKPWQPEQLLLTLKSAANVWRLQQDNQRLSLELRAAEPVLASKVEMKYERVKRELGLDGLTRSAGSPMNPVCDMVQRIAPYDLSVLLMGESGTGKEMLARAIHYQSRRDRQAFVVENCGALPDQLLEAELFGYKRGAFTGAYEDRIGLFQQADGGTIFLDEIGETSPAFQVKLLRVLQEGEFRPPGQPPAGERQRAGHRRHQPGPGGRSAGRPLPRGPLLPPGHRHPARAAFTGTAHGHSPAGPAPAGSLPESPGQDRAGLHHRDPGLHRRLSLARQCAGTAERNPAHAGPVRRQATGRRAALAPGAAGAGGGP